MNQSGTAGRRFAVQAADSAVFAPLDCYDTVNGYTFHGLNDCIGTLAAFNSFRAAVQSHEAAHVSCTISRLATIGASAPSDFEQMVRGTAEAVNWDVTRDLSSLSTNIYASVKQALDNSGGGTWYGFWFVEPGQSQWQMGAKVELSC